VIAGIMLMVQISIFRVLPEYIKSALSYFPAFGFILNVLASIGIMYFTGGAQLVGISNMAASVAFGGYITLYKHVREPYIVRRFGVLPIFKLKKAKSWIF